MNPVKGIEATEAILKKVIEKVISEKKASIDAAAAAGGNLEFNDGHIGIIISEVMVELQYNTAGIIHDVHMYEPEAPRVEPEDDYIEPGGGEADQYFADQM
jgi:hypothetical protein